MKSILQPALMLSLIAARCTKNQVVWLEGSRALPQTTRLQQKDDVQRNEAQRYSIPETIGRNESDPVEAREVETSSGSGPSVP